MISRFGGMLYVAMCAGGCGLAMAQGVPADPSVMALAAPIPGMDPTLVMGETMLRYGLIGALGFRFLTVLEGFRALGASLLELGQGALREMKDWRRVLEGDVSISLIHRDYRGGLERQSTKEVEI